MELGTDILGDSTDSTAPRQKAGRGTFHEQSREDKSAYPDTLRSLRTVVRA